LRPLEVLEREQIFTEDPEWRRPGRSNYLAMYSSVFGGVVTDPALMVIPLDDRMATRGDAIFDFVDVVNGSVYNLDAHLTRLGKSAEIISLDLPFDMDTIKQITLETIAISGAKTCAIHLYASRGLGDLGCDPTGPGKSILYVIVSEPGLSGLFPPDLFTKGASAITTHVPAKPGFYAHVKSCCYLLNALLILEARRNNATFGIWYDQEGHLTESATLNVAIVSQEKVLKYPRFEHMLKGTALIRVVELANGLTRSGELGGISQIDISQQEVYNCSEMLALSTGLVVPIVEYDGRTIGTGKPGIVFQRLRELLEKDRTENSEMLTPVPYR